MMRASHMESAWRSWRSWRSLDSHAAAGDNPGMSRNVLFLCTGNYYRSRFAEALFNHLASKHQLAWVATSRALAIELGLYNPGPISIHARTALTERGLPLAEPVRHPIQCSEEDLASATKIIALKEAEHRPYLTKRYPAWPDRVEYWHIHDLDKATPGEAMNGIAEKVEALIANLTQDGWSNK
jgi:protein-tyrosine phosphatase